MRRIILSVCLLLAIAIPCQAQNAKPNTLTPKEIADGWILLFDGETTFGWNDSGKVAIAQGAFILTGEAAEITTSSIWAEHEIHFEYRIQKSKDANLKARHDLIGTGNSFPLQRFNDDWIRARMTHQLKPGPGRLATTRIVWESAERKLGNATHGDFPFKTMNHRFAGPTGAILELRNIKLRPLNPTSIFNGKDLAGWKVFPKKKSEFAVIDNAINVKDGPGDLQTVDKYQDFILQLECISNGKHLNSGIFFRCKDNEYQNGYEAQIFNKFTAEATQKYFVEEYDPKTNKLLAKKEMMSTAVDFGTGAIYRRVPARKEMSKDGEWFSMTIATHGNHFATWVNGVQVVDWTDNRPRSDNPRTGCRLEAGHISIQGHDPTTNLSFRNFRIAELPTTK